jgi:3-hydroxyisobutyrate dehydrogenase
MVGGDSRPIEAVSGILSTLGTTITRTGGIGSGQAMKALNNLTSATGLAKAVEVILIGQAWGLEPDLMVDVLNASTGMSNSTLKKVKQFVLSENFDSGFGLDLAVKDIKTALDIADAVGVHTVLAPVTGALFSDAQQFLGPGHDHTEVARYLRSLAGPEEI